MWNYRFNFENCCWWKFVRGASTIIKTITGLFPLSWQDGIGGDLVDYSLTGANSSNVWDEEWEVGGWSEDGKTSETDRIRGKNYIPCLPNTDYYRVIPDGSLIRTVFWDNSYNYISKTSFDESGRITTPENCYYMTFYTSGSYGTVYNHDISINYPSTDHDYHPHGVGDYGGKRNQLVVNGNFESTSGWGAEGGTISATNNVCVFVAEEGIAGNARIQQANINIISSHKVYLSFSLKTPINERCTVYSDAWEEFCEVETLANVKKNVSIIKELNQNANILRIYFNSNESLQGGDTVEIENVQFIDLTAMFPNDTPTDVSTAKARIAEVMGGQQEYYEYDAGTDYYCIPVSVKNYDESYEQEHTIYRTSQLVANQTIRKTTDGLPNFTSLPTGYLQMGVDTQVQPSAGSVTYKSRSVSI